MVGRGGYGVEVIATGDEILFGRIVDTNSSYIARRATEAGARLRRITCVGDETDEIAQVVREALARSNHLIILTGGLGPSEDDLTIESIGVAVGRKVEINPQALEMVRRKCEDLGVELTPRRARMARLLEGAAPLANSVGMAPGMLLQEGQTKMVALPGIPEEMKGIFDSHVVNIIEGEATSKFLAKTVVVQIVWKEFFPIYESMMRDFPGVYIKNKATPPVRGDEREKVWEILVDVVVEAPSRDEGERKMGLFLEELRNRVEAKGGRMTI